MGFNNTGNVCVWPSEELLTHVVLAHDPAFYSDKVVLELGTAALCSPRCAQHVVALGGGMASLAALALATTRPVRQ